jgi:hypothetical protein
MTFLAASGLAIALSDLASAQSLGGFPIREPGASGSAGDSSTGAAARNEVIVSKDAGSKVTTIAQAMRLVRPGGVILVKGGVYNENIEVTKPVEIRGVPGDYGRNAIIRPAADAPCVSIAPRSPIETVSISRLVFEFDASAPRDACIEVHGGTVSISDSFVVPSNSDILVRAGYGPLADPVRPEILDQLARPTRDRGVYQSASEAFAKCKEKSDGQWCKATAPEAVTTCAESGYRDELICQSPYAINGALVCRGSQRSLWCRANGIVVSGRMDDAERLESYIAKHARPVGADHAAWNVAAGGTRIEEILHAGKNSGAGLLSGPTAGVLVSAGDVRLDRNVIVGARTAVSFVSDTNTNIKGALTNNVIIGNGVGIAAAGGAADLLMTRNTIRYNVGDGIRADVYDGVKIIANEISGNKVGIFLSEKVRMATVSSNLVARNFSDAMRVSSGFFGAVGGNTFIDNAGCTMQFYSAEMKTLNDADIKVVAFRDFYPRVMFEESNESSGNLGDVAVKKSRRTKVDNAPTIDLAACESPL